MHHLVRFRRFLCPPWQKVQLESKELMAACLRKIPGLSKVKLIGICHSPVTTHQIEKHIVVSNDRLFVASDCTCISLYHKSIGECVDSFISEYDTFSIHLLPIALILGEHAW